MDAQLDRETVMKYLRELPLDDRLDVIAEIIADLKSPTSQERPKQKKSLRGILKDLGPAPSAEAIDEARREMWGNFPRDDIA